MKRLGVCIFALWATSTSAESLDACVPDAVLFASTSEKNERDVPKATSIVLKLEASREATFTCTKVSGQSAVELWKKSLMCDKGVTTIVVWWKADGTISATCE